MKLEKVGMSPDFWDKSWDFEHFSWEIQKLESSNTACKVHLIQMLTASDDMIQHVKYGI